MALTLAGVWVEDFPWGALLHPRTFTATCFVVEALVMRTGRFTGAFALTGLGVEPLVGRAILLYAVADTGACYRIVSLPMCAAGPVSRART